MNKFHYISIFTILLFSCNTDTNIIGSWVEQIESGPNTIPKLVPADWEGEEDADFKLYVKFSKDSITIKEYKTLRTTFWETNDNDEISFPDKNGRAINWKIIEVSDSLLIIERSGGGFCPNTELVKFKKL